MLRFIASIAVGVVIAFGLFVVMAKLIDGGSKSASNNEVNFLVEINMTPPESEAKKNTRTPPPPPKPPKQPPKPKTPVPDVDFKTDNVVPDLGIPAVDVGDMQLAPLAGPGDLSREGDAAPIFRMEPNYPQRAARDGIEGWVKLSFDVTELGEVDNIKVLDSSPKRVFDREARKALARWKYAPKVEDGKAMRQVGFNVQLDFTLGE